MRRREELLRNLARFNRVDDRVDSKETISQFVRVREVASGVDAIPTMSRMLLVDRTISDINVQDSTFYEYTALHYQAEYGTTGSVAWLLRQDPPPDIEVRSTDQYTPLMLAALSSEDSEGKVRLLLDHGANRDKENQFEKADHTVLSLARWLNKPASIIDILENYRPDVSR